MLVEIKNLSKQFTSLALDNISASFPKGKIIGIVGPDGSGKTTLIRLMAGLLKPTAGSITIEGYDTIKNAEKVHFLTGYMPQRFGLYEDLTVLQNLNLYADLRGVIGEERKQTFEKLLKFTGLAPFTDRFARALSGGMKQKLGLACALVKKPALLLLDEPSVGVDPISRRELWTMVYDLIEDGISVVWSTAYLDEAERCNTTLLLNEGRLCFFGDPHELTERVNHRTFKVFNIEGDRRKLLFDILKDKNVMDGVIQGRDLRILIREHETPPQGLHVEPTPPRFEDGFIDILGGGPGGFSELASKAPTVQDGVHIVIVAEKLTKKFGTFTAAENISLQVKKGEIFGLLGPNGAGKTTTFKMLCGLLKPTSGQASVNGVDLLKAPSVARSHIGYMAQKFSLYGNLSVFQNLDFFAGIYNLSNHEKKIAIQEMIETFSLRPYLDASADSLPLGFKQRLALACANMHHPPVLFLDEPTSGVDPITRREFWNHINGLVGKGVTIMVTTHFMDEAEYCDRIALVYRGKIINMDTPDSLKDKAKAVTLEEAFIKMIEDYDRR
ncbi:MAG: ABC transporter ATP-binding protein [Rhabdochlamydiaceae bacterium]|nr:ABC transporter ATP-binding protein [Rhabdochlamydiaceae bacterium]